MTTLFAKLYHVCPSRHLPSCYTNWKASKNLKGRFVAVCSARLPSNHSASATRKLVMTSYGSLFPSSVTMSSVFLSLASKSSKASA